MSDVQMMPPAAAVATEGPAAYDANSSSVAVTGGGAVSSSSSASDDGALAQTQPASRSVSRRRLLQGTTSSPAQLAGPSRADSATDASTATVAAAALDDSAAVSSAPVPSAVPAASVSPRSRSRPNTARRSTTTRHPSAVRILQRLVTERPKPKAWVLHPDSRSYKWWLVLIIVVIFANVWSVPFRLSVGYNRIQGDFTGFTATDILFDLIYFVNIALKTRIAFYRDGALITDPRLIWEKYCGFDLFVDVFSVLPLDWILLLSRKYVEAVFLRLSRLVQFLFVARYLSNLETSPGVNVTAVRLGKVTIFYLLLSHLTGCAWFAFALPDRFGDDEWLPPREILDHPYASQYLRSLYWGLATLSDRIENPNPSTPGTVAFIIATQVIGVLLLAYIIGNIAFAIDDANETFQRFRLQLDYVQRFMTHAKLPERMQERVRDYYHHTWQQSRGFDDFQMLKDLPSTLRTDVCLQLTASTVGANSLFQGLDQNFLHGLVKVLMQRTLVPDEYLIREGEPGSEMYFLRQGLIAILVAVHDQQQPQAQAQQQRQQLAQGEELSPSHEVLSPRGRDSSAVKYLTSMSTPTPPGAASSAAPTAPSSPRPPQQRQVQTCVDGDLIGEFCVLLQESCPVRTSSAMALAYCDLFVLRQEDLAQLLSFYPLVQTELEDRTKRRRNQTLRLEENILGASDVDVSHSHAVAHKPGSAPSVLSNPSSPPPASQMNGGGTVAVVGTGSSTLNPPDSASDHPAGPVIKTVSGRVVPPDSLQYRALLWLRTYWLTNAPCYEWWMRWIALISLYNALCVPYRLAFDFEQAHPAMLFFDYLFDCFLIFNVFAHLWLRQPPRLGNTTLSAAASSAAAGGVAATFESFRAARRRYLTSGWLLWDVGTSLPLDFIMLRSGGGMNPWFRSGKVMRFFTDVRVLSNSKLQSAGLNGSAVGLLQLSIGFVLMSHWMSCAYWSFSYTVGWSEGFGAWLPSRSVAAQGRLASYLWATFQTYTLQTGLGEKAAPEGDLEILYVIFMILLGILLVAWAIGEVGELIANLDRFNAEFGRQMLATSAFMSYRRFSPSVQKRVRNYLSHWWSTRRGVDPHVAMEGLPVGLRSAIMRHLCEHVLRRVPLFARLLQSNPSFGRHLIERLRFESYPAGEFVWHQGEIADNMAFITEGEVGVIVAPDPPQAAPGAPVMATGSSTYAPRSSTRPAKILGVGSFFGEVALLTNGLRTASIRALRPTFLLVLAKESLWEIMEVHPDFAAEIRSLSAERAARMAYIRIRGTAALQAQAAQAQIKQAAPDQTDDTADSDGAAPAHVRVQFADGADGSGGQGVADRSQSRSHSSRSHSSEFDEEDSDDGWYSDDPLDEDNVLEYGSDISRSQGEVHVRAKQHPRIVQLQQMQQRERERQRALAAAAADASTAAAATAAAAGGQEPVLEGATKAPAYSHFLGADSSDEEEEADLHFGAARDDHHDAHEQTIEMASVLMASDPADDEAAAMRSGALHAPDDSVLLNIPPRPSVPASPPPPTLRISSISSPRAARGAGSGPLFTRQLSIDTRDAEEEAEADAVDEVLARADPSSAEDVVAVALHLTGGPAAPAPTGSSATSTPVVAAPKPALSRRHTRRRSSAAGDTLMLPSGDRSASGGHPSSPARSPGVGVGPHAHEPDRSSPGRSHSASVDSAQHQAVPVRAISGTMNMLRMLERQNSMTQILADTGDDGDPSPIGTPATAGASSTYRAARRLDPASASFHAGSATGTGTGASPRPMQQQALFRSSTAGAAGMGAGATGPVSAPPNSASSDASAWAGQMPSLVHGESAPSSSASSSMLPPTPLFGRGMGLMLQTRPQHQQNLGGTRVPFSPVSGRHAMPFGITSPAPFFARQIGSSSSSVSMGPTSPTGGQPAQLQRQASLRDALAQGSFGPLSPVHAGGMHRSQSSFAAVHSNALALAQSTLSAVVGHGPGHGQGGSLGAGRHSRSASFASDHPADQSMEEMPMSALSRARSIDRRSLGGGMLTPSSSTGVGAGVADIVPMSVFAQARRLHASRTIETAVRNGVLRSEAQLADVVHAVEAQLEADEWDRREQAEGREGKRARGYSFSISPRPLVSQLQSPAQVLQSNLSPPMTSGVTASLSVATGGGAGGAGAGVSTGIGGSGGAGGASSTNRRGAPNLDRRSRGHSRGPSFGSSLTVEEVPRLSVSLLANEKGHHSPGSNSSSGSPAAPFVPSFPTYPFASLSVPGGDTHQQQQQQPLQQPQQHHAAPPLDRQTSSPDDGPQPTLSIHLLSPQQQHSRRIDTSPNRRPVQAQAEEESKVAADAAPSHDEPASSASAVAHTSVGTHESALPSSSSPPLALHLNLDLEPDTAKQGQDGAAPAAGVASLHPLHPLHNHPALSPVPEGASPYSSTLTPVYGSRPFSQSVPDARFEISAMQASPVALGHRQERADSSEAFVASLHRSDGSMYSPSSRALSSDASSPASATATAMAASSADANAPAVTAPVAQQARRPVQIHRGSRLPDGRRQSNPRTSAANTPSPPPPQPASDAPPSSSQQ